VLDKIEATVRDLVDARSCPGLMRVDALLHYSLAMWSVVDVH
jgi:hypothetical protein